MLRTYKVQMYFEMEIERDNDFVKELALERVYDYAYDEWYNMVGDADMEIVITEE